MRPQPHRPALKWTHGSKSLRRTLIGSAPAVVFILLVIPVAAPGYIAHANGYDGESTMTEGRAMFNRRLSTRENAGSILVGLTVTVMLLCHAAVVSAQSQCWTMAGSTGTVDEAALNIVTLTNNTAAISSAVAAATADIRYNVLAMNGVFGGAMNGKELTVRFADNGPAAQVIVRVQRVHIDTGVLTTLGTLNSNFYPASTVAQTRTAVVNCQGPELDFQNHIYYIEAQLIKTGAGGTPLIRSLQICPSFVACSPEE
jgi:hypothetical protein